MLLALNLALAAFVLGVLLATKHGKLKKFQLGFFIIEFYKS